MGAREPLGADLRGVCVGGPAAVGGAVMWLWALKNWRYLAMGLLAIAIGIQTLRLAWSETKVAEWEAKYDKREKELAQAVIREQSRADTISGDLVIEQAIAMNKATEKETVYVTQLKEVKVPDNRVCSGDPRMRIGSHGVRDEIGGVLPKFAAPAPGADGRLPASGAGR